MQLTGAHIAQIRDALLAAFNKHTLAEMVRVELDVVLSHVADGENLRIVAFNLVSWAEQQGRIEELIQAACRANGGNPQLQQLLRNSRSWPTAKAPGGQAGTPAAQAGQADAPAPASIDIFLSYSRQDADAMQAVQEILRAAELVVWTDEGLKPGTQSWTAAIEEAIQQASSVVVLLSPAAKASIWVNNEIAYAQVCQKPIFPLLLAGDESNAVPIRLITMQWIDGRQDLRRAAERLLVEALRYRQPGEAGAGQALVESSTLGQAGERNRSKLERERQELLDALRGDALPAVDRARAGQALARLGDLRSEVLDPLRMEFCYVPPGPFMMGEEKEQHQYDVRYGYWIGRYPVTNQQFAAFVDAGGYREGKYWPEAQEEGLWRAGKFRDRDRPYRFGEPFDLANHPVVGVTWYEALAFVRWLDAVSAKPAGFALRLPSEPEWEKAARGGLEVMAQHIVAPLEKISSLGAAPLLQRNPLARRAHPWGKEPDSECANYGETKIGSTSVVGCFAHGASPYGVEDLSGNVWEWTRSLWAENPYPSAKAQLAQREDLKAGPNSARVLRGGSYLVGAAGVRCAVRVRYYPNDRDVNIGFRVVASPSTSGL